jgi:hypothetical protein
MEALLCRDRIRALELQDSILEDGERSEPC